MKRILIADDESHIRRILEFNLKRAGYEVLATEDGRAALALALSARPDLVILDVSMPELCIPVRRATSVPSCLRLTIARRK